MLKFDLFVSKECSLKRTPYFDFSIIQMSDCPRKPIGEIEDVSDELSRYLNNLLLLHYQWECNQFETWLSSMNVFERMYNYCFGDIDLPSKLLNNELENYYQASTGVYQLELLYDVSGKLIWISLKNCRQNQIQYNNKQVSLHCFIENEMLNLPFQIFTHDNIN